MAFGWLGDKKRLPVGIDTWVAAIVQYNGCRGFVNIVELKLNQ